MSIAQASPAVLASSIACSEVMQSTIALVSLVAHVDHRRTSSGGVGSTGWLTVDGAVSCTGTRPACTSVGEMVEELSRITWSASPPNESIIGGSVLWPVPSLKTTSCEWKIFCDVG